jgi:hypothetical protein
MQKQTVFSEKTWKAVIQQKTNELEVEFLSRSGVIMSTPIYKQMSIPRLLMHIMKDSPQLYNSPVKKYLKIAKRKYAKTGKRGTFCLVYGSLQDAYEFKAVHNMMWRPFDHEMVRDFSSPPLTQLSSYDVERAYHVLIVVSTKDGKEWKRREMVFSAPPETLAEMAKEEVEEAKQGDNDNNNDATSTSSSSTAPKLSKSARKNAKRRAKLKAQKQNQSQ